jgi:hypothetical protein
MSDPLDPVRDLLARLTRERDEATARAERLERELVRMGKANGEACDTIHELRAMVERAHTDRAAE